MPWVGDEGSVAVIAEAEKNPLLSARVLSAFRSLKVTLLMVTVLPEAEVVTPGPPLNVITPPDGVAVPDCVLYVVATVPPEETNPFASTLNCPLLKAAKPILVASVLAIA